jgi:hypothetical protein
MKSLGVAFALVLIIPFMMPSLARAQYEYRVYNQELDVCVEITDSLADCHDCAYPCGTSWYLQSSYLALGVDQVAPCLGIPAHGWVTGRIFLRAYVDPATGEPKSKSLGGVAVCPVPGADLRADFRGADQGHSYAQVSFGYWNGGNGVYNATLTVGTTVAATGDTVGSPSANILADLDTVTVRSLPLPFEMEGNKAACDCNDGVQCYLYWSHAKLISSTPLRYEVATPAGSAVPVDLPGEIDLEFESVNAPGDTWVLRRLEGPAFPSWMIPSGLPYAIYFDVGTTADTSGDIQVCVNYDEDYVVGQEDDLVLYQYDAAHQVWVELPTSVDTSANRVCASTRSLSMFVLAEGHAVEFVQAQTFPTVVGAAVGDYDADGDPDVFLANGGDPNILLRDDDGVLVVATPPELEMGDGVTRRGSWGDMDNDGYLDLYVSDNGGSRLFRYDGSGFVDVTASPIDLSGECFGSAWADYDGDGLLDLVSGVGDAHLFHNLGDGTFEEVALETPGMCVRGVSWADFDLDDDPDLLVAGGPINVLGYGGCENRLYENSAGLFTDVTPPAIQVSSTRAASWGDFDNDGDFDLFLSEAGANEDLEWESGHRLFENQLESGFTEVQGEPWGEYTSPGSYNYDGTGAEWVDFDLDGDLDLYSPSANSSFGNRLYRNDGDRFVDITSQLFGGDSYSSAYAGAVWMDCDGDGDPDLFMPSARAQSTGQYATRLFTNENVLGNHWLEVRLVGSASNAGGIGARIMIEAGGARQTRELQAGGGLFTSSTLPALFGTGRETVVESMVVHWPTGVEQTFYAVPTDTRQVIHELVTEPTPQGTEVGVQLTDAVALTFDDVGTEGETSLSESTIGPPTEGVFAVNSDPTVFYELSTSAAYNGNVVIRVRYDETTLTIPESAVRLYHYDADAVPPQWVDITTDVDTEANVVSGSCSSLSPFVLGADPSVVGIEDGQQAAGVTMLYQNFPNPFNPTTLIRYEVAEPGRVKIQVYDVRGMLVRVLEDRIREAGRYEVEWNGENIRGEKVSSGVYFCRMTAPGYAQTRKMVMLK